MRALQKLSAVCVATGFLLSSGWGLGWHLDESERMAKADTLVEIQGSLVSGDAVLDDGSLYDQYVFSGGDGQYVTISLESNDFDPYLILLDPNGRRIGENDDISRTNRNSRLIVTLPLTGEYTAVANSYESGKNGQYAIRVDVADNRTALLQTLASAAVPDSNNVCTRAIAGMASSIESNLEVDALVSSLQLSRLYVDGPAARPYGVNVAVSGPAALSVMFSPQLLTRLSAQLVSSCSSVGAVVFSTESGNAEASDLERIFGLLPRSGETTAQVVQGADAAERVEEFACVSRGENAATLPGWGERVCS